jgi:hypothetical protein
MEQSLPRRRRCWATGAKADKRSKQQNDKQQKGYNWPHTDITFTG